jgi:hypothetical protein
LDQPSVTFDLFIGCKIFVQIYQKEVMASPWCPKSVLYILKRRVRRLEIAIYTAYICSYFFITTTLLITISRKPWLISTNEFCIQRPAKKAQCTNFLNLIWHPGPGFQVMNIKRILFLWVWISVSAFFFFKSAENYNFYCLVLPIPRLSKHSSLQLYCKAYTFDEFLKKNKFQFIFQILTSKCVYDCANDQCYSNYKSCMEAQLWKCNYRAQFTKFTNFIRTAKICSFSI